MLLDVQPSASNEIELEGTLRKCISGTVSALIDLFVIGRYIHNHMLLHQMLACHYPKDTWHPKLIDCV